MKGTLRQRGPDRWQLQVDLGRDPITGRRRTQSRTITAPHTRAGRKTAEHELARLVLAATAHQAPAVAPRPVIRHRNTWLHPRDSLDV